MTRRLHSPVPAWVPDDLPAAPGVYQFEGVGGVPLYVGKSVNVRRRVRSYFYSGGPTDSRLAEMLRVARAVEAWRTGSDVEARIEEAERIARHRPPYNRALKNRARGWYLEIDWGEPFPRLRVVREPRRVTARYFGPLRGRRLAAELAGAAERLCRLRTCAGPLRPDASGSPCLQHGIGLCTAPCVKEVGLDAYRAQVREAEALLADGGRAGEWRRRLAMARERALAGGRPDRAAEIGRRLARAVELEDLRRALDHPRMERSWLLALRGPDPGEAVLVPVARGRVLPRRGLRWEVEWEARVLDVCYSVRVAALRAETAFPPEAIGPSLIVQAWLEEGAPGGVALDLDRLEDEEAVADLRRSRLRTAAA